MPEGKHEDLRVPAAPAITLVGRVNELGTLGDALQSGQSRGVALAIIGDAGIGKSELLAAGADLARARGYTVLSAVGVEDEWNLPYAGLHRLLLSLMPDSGRLPVPQQRALRAAFGLDAHEPPQPFLVSLAALTLLSIASSRAPVLVCIDDVHWLDQPSQDALAFAARRLDAEALVLLGSARNGHASVFVDACARRLEVCGLDDTSAQALLSRHAPDLSIADQRRILAHALGNPLAIVELPAALRSTVPVVGDLVAEPVPLSARLERAFAARFDDLPAATRDALIITATGSQCDLAEILAATSVLAGRPVSIAEVESAAQAGLVSIDRRAVTFRHPLVRSAVLQAESAQRRRAAHEALAEALRDDPFRRTWHRGEATVGSDDQLADELEYVHAIALRRGSALAGIGVLERSAALTTDSALRGRRLLLAAEHAFGLGRADMVDRLLAAAGRNTLSELERARMEWLREIFNDGVPGDALRVIELCRSAWRSRAAGDTDLALNLLLGAALRCWWADTGPEARAFVADTLRGLAGAATDARYVAALAVAEPVLECATVEQILAGVVLETVTDASDLRLYGWAAHAVGDPARAVDFFDRAEHKFREQGRLGLLSHVLVMGAVDRLQIGEWRRARLALVEAQQIADDTGQPIWGVGARSVTAMEMGLRGEAAAHETATQAEHVASGGHLNVMLTCVQLAHGYAFASAQQYPEAYAALRRIFDPADPARHERESFTGIMVFAEAGAHAGQLEDARAIVADLELLAKVCPSPVLHDQLRYARAVLADDDDAEGLFQDALATDLVRWPWTKGRLQLGYGSWLRRRRRITESRPLLREARAAFEVIGAAAWAEQARIELRAAGERSTEPGQTPAEDILSPQELQIAWMAADGLTNKQCGARLYLSPRTVGSHLYRIFPKLGITSRGQIAARLSRR